MNNKQRFIDLLKSTERKGIENLIQRLEIGGFFTSPCSTRHHLAEPGGLLKHSLNVYDTAATLKKALNSHVLDESIIICTLLHDIGKCGDYGKPYYVENILKSGKQAATPYASNSDLLYLPHEIRSVTIAERFIPLKEEEEHAIIMHNGLYSDMKYAINGHETELYLILHDADLWCSRIIEE